MLTINQQRYLAERLLASSDAEAARAAGFSAATIVEWKKEPEFLAAYNKLGTDGIELARDILRQHLGKAALTVLDVMQEAVTEKGSKDYAVRLSAAVKALESHGVIRRLAQIAGDPEHPLVVTGLDEIVRALRRKPAQEQGSGSDTSGAGA